MYKKIVMGSLLLSCLTASTFANIFSHSEASIDGSYACSAIDLTLTDNHHVTGKFALQKDGNVYIVTQLNDANEPTNSEYNTIAIRSGNVLSIAYQNIVNPKIFGIENMLISRDGNTLHGTFIYSNRNSPGSLSTVIASEAKQSSP